MQLYKITTSDHFRHWWSNIIMTILFPFVIYFVMIFKKGYFEWNTALLVSGITYFLYVFPALLLHLHYYYSNRNDIFQYEKLSGQMIYRKGDSIVTFGQDDIKRITVLKSNTLSENRASVFAWDHYNYAVIELIDGRVIKLSSFLVDELDNVVRFADIEIKKTLYAWID